LRRAKALYAVFDQMPIFMRPGELLVGQRAARLAARAVYPEFNLNGLTQENTPAEIWGYWHGHTLGDEVRGAHPERLRKAEREMAAGYVTGTDSGFGHVIVDYEKALTQGFDAIITQAERSLEQAPEDDLEGRAFLQGVVIAARAIIRWAARYAELAEEQASAEQDPARRAEFSASHRSAGACPPSQRGIFRRRYRAFGSCTWPCILSNTAGPSQPGGLTVISTPTTTRPSRRGSYQESRRGSCCSVCGEIHGERGQPGQGDGIPEPHLGRAGRARARLLQ